IFYYPVQEDDRATGFLIPVYGTSTIRGQSLSNAFFWAISRSQDATFMHDWYSRTGQGFGGEYRYIAGPGSDGSLRTYFLREHEVTYTDSSGGQRVQPSRQSYELRGRLSQALPGGLRARGDVDYFSNVSVQQLYQTNLYQSSQRQRSYGGNVTGSWGANSVSGTYNVRELFFDEDRSTLTGNGPRFAYQRAPRRLFGSPVYFQFGSEYNKIVRTFTATESEDDVQGLTRIDLSPQLRLPLSRWPFLGVQATFAWRQTYYSESFNEDGKRVPEWLGRQFIETRAEITGPTFTRIFDTRNGFAERIKHVIEPTVAIQRASLIENYDRIVKLESYDYTYGGTTRITYGLTNRFLARKPGSGQQTSAREFAVVSLSQTYYTDEKARSVDPSLNSSWAYLEPRKLSPWILAANVSPSEQINAGMRMEYDQYEKHLLSIGLSSRYGYKDVVAATGGWSRTRRNLEGTQFDNAMNVGTNIRVLQGRLGGFFGFDYDFFRDQMLQRRIQAFYNSQCCGVGFEFQTRNLSGFSQFLYPNDRRFNFTFTLAGVGTFSNIFGIFGNGNSTGQR
ncbi:MAG: LPS-assembly protein LptD, partial [Vicinamibacterales bacterium]